MAESIVERFYKEALNRHIALSIEETVGQALYVFDFNDQQICVPRNRNSAFRFINLAREFGEDFHNSVLNLITFEHYIANPPHIMHWCASYRFENPEELEVISLRDWLYGDAHAKAVAKVESDRRRAEEERKSVIIGYTVIFSLLVFCIALYFLFVKIMSILAI